MSLDPTLSLCMIVKNEAENLPRALESVYNLVDEMIIIDTGSHDHSMEIARNYGAMVFTFPWQGDFSEAKNDALEQASGDWILQLDADEMLDVTSADKIKKLIAEGSKEGYYFKRKNYTTREGVLLDQRLALFQRRPSYRFQGIFGERITPLFKQKGSSAAVHDIVIHHNGYLQKEIKKKNKLQRNVEVICQYRQTYSNDPSYFYWLAVQFFREGWYHEVCQLCEQVLIEKKIELSYFSHALLLLAQSYLMLQDVERCKTILEQGMEWFSDYLDLYYVKGIAHMYEEEWEAALLSFKYCTSRPSPPLHYITEEGLCKDPCYRNIAICYQQLGQIEKMKELLTGTTNTAQF